MPQTSDRFLRQADIVPRDAIKDTPVTVIGVGAGGRNVGIQLAAIGVPKLQIIDFDKVEGTNVTTQGYPRTDIGLPKVESLKKTILALTDDCVVECVNDRYRPDIEVHPVVFCCVDTISAREAIWRGAGKHAKFWTDARMLGETIRVLAACDEASRDYYPTTFFAESESNRGRCTAQSTIYAANISAALQVHQFTRWLRGFDIEPDATLNLLSGEMFSEYEEFLRQGRDCVVSNEALAS